jgi:UDP-N-acetyl-2-amino-2-deoxyglucuronate dehydrogenase
VDGVEVEFSEGFVDLHTKVYADVLGGGGFGIDDARPAIELAYQIRTGQIQPAAEAIASGSAY